MRNSRGILSLSVSVREKITTARKPKPDIPSWFRLKSSQRAPVGPSVRGSSLVARHAGARCKVGHPSGRLRIPEPTPLWACCLAPNLYIHLQSCSTYKHSHTAYLRRDINKGQQIPSNFQCTCSPAGGHYLVLAFCSINKPGFKDIGVGAFGLPCKPFRLAARWFTQVAKSPVEVSFEKNRCTKRFQWTPWEQVRK